MRRRRDDAMRYWQPPEYAQAAVRQYLRLRRRRKIFGTAFIVAVLWVRRRDRGHAACGIHPRFASVPGGNNA